LFNERAVDAPIESLTDDVRCPTSRAAESCTASRRSGNGCSTWQAPHWSPDGDRRLRAPGGRSCGPARSPGNLRPTASWGGDSPSRPPAVAASR